MEVSFCSFIVDAVRRRMKNLIYELQLIDAQLSLFGTVPGTSAQDRGIPALQHNIKSTLYDIGNLYCQSMESLCSHSTPLRNVISSHLFTLKQTNLMILLQELYGHQSALTTLVGREYVSTTQNANSDCDHHLRMGSLIFPYELVFGLLSEAKFMNEFLDCVLRYKPATHGNSIAVLFRLIQGRKSVLAYASQNTFFTGSRIVVFMLAEHFLTFFARDRMLRDDWSPLRNFASEEKSRLIEENAIENCGLSPAIIERLEKAQASMPTQTDIKLEYIRRIDAPMNPLSVEKMVVPGLIHVVLELRKLPLQLSPSLMLDTLSTALHYLAAAVTCDGSAIGADESFQFFVYCLAVARIKFLPAICSFITKFCDDALKETRAQYFLTQLQGGVEFINNRMMPVQPFLLFPFKSPPRRVADLIEPADTPHVLLTGFALYAFPTWSRHVTDLFPAMLRYTGDEQDVAVCYQYRMTKSDGMSSLLADGLDPVPAQPGTFFQVSLELIQSGWMMKVDNGDFEGSSHDIAALSAMILMNEIKIKDASTGMINSIYQGLIGPWRLKPEKPQDGIRKLVAEMQIRLVELKFLRDHAPIHGILDFETLGALQKCLYGDKPTFVFTPRALEFLRSAVRKT
jgi:hypothetical protein